MWLESDHAKTTTLDQRERWDADAIRQTSWNSAECGEPNLPWGRCERPSVGLHRYSDQRGGDASGSLPGQEEAEGGEVRHLWVIEWNEDILPREKWRPLQDGISMLVYRTKREAKSELRGFQLPGCLDGRIVKYTPEAKRGRPPGKGRK